MSHRTTQSLIRSSRCLEREGYAITHGWGAAQSTGQTYDIWARVYRPDCGWQDPLLLETADGQAYEPRVAMGADGNGIAIWYQQSAGHLGTWSARYRPRHGWSSPELLHHYDSFDDVLPSVEIDAHGNALAIWLQTTGYVYTARYDHAQAAWQPANWISAASSPIGYHSSLSFDADGNAMAIWYQGDGSHSHVWTRRFQ